jgi:2-haloalkanoic acid dehalogenase type II
LTLCISGSEDLLTRYDAILLDVGSTLLEYRPSLRTRAWADIIGASPDATEAAFRDARAAARPLSEFETRDEYDAFRTEVCSLTLEALGFRGDRSAAAHAMSDVWIRVGWEVFADVHPVLSELRADGYRLGVVSNWTATLELTLEHVGLAAYFDVVACSSVVGATKPDPKIFRHALTTLGVEPVRALHVGDHLEADVLGAEDAGMDAVLIVRDESSDDVPSSSVRKIRTLHELRAMVDARS